MQRSRLKLTARIYFAISLAFIPVSFGYPAFAAYCGIYEDANYDSETSSISCIYGSVAEGELLNLTAQEGYIITGVYFASYGTPEDYNYSECHATNSAEIVASYIQGNSITIPADNVLFDDPCTGTTKRLSVILLTDVDPEPEPEPEPIEIQPEPTSLEVTSTLDDGSVGTLRWAILEANALSGGINDSIVFSTSGVIELTSNLPPISQNLNIEGNNSIEISGADQFQIFAVNRDITLNSSDMTLSNGRQANGGMVFLNRALAFNSTNMTFTGQNSGSAVFINNSGVATYNNAYFYNNSVGIASDHGSTPQLPVGVTTWTDVPDSVFQNRTYINNSLFSDNAQAVMTFRFTYINGSTFLNNDIATNITGLNRTQIYNSTFIGNTVGYYNFVWTPTHFNMGTDNRLIQNNTFIGNLTAIINNDSYNNRQRFAGWSTFDSNTFDGNSMIVEYFQWDGEENQSYIITESDLTTPHFVFTNSVVVLPPPPSPEPTPEPTPTQEPTPTPTQEPTPSEQPTPQPTQPIEYQQPSPPTELIPSEPTISPTPVKTQEPSPSQTPQPSPTPKPDPTSEPEPEPEPIPSESVPAPSETPTPKPTLTSPPSSTPAPSLTQNPLPTPVETLASVPEPTPTRVASPLPTPTPQPESTRPLPVQEVKEKISSENIISFVEEIVKIQEPRNLSSEQVAEITSAAYETFQTSEQGSPEYESALKALAVVAQADDPELPKELASIPLLGDVAGAVLEVFNNIGNIGADMSPEIRETSEEVVIAAVIVGQIASQAAVASALRIK